MRNALITVSFTLLSAGLALAQSSGYNKANEMAIEGSVRYVLSAASPDGAVGVHLELTTPTGPVRVALAPAAFIASNNYYFFVEEKVYLIGAKAKNGEIWARTISKDGKKFLVLRNEDGTPRWTQAAEEDGCGVSHAPIR